MQYTTLNSKMAGSLEWPGISSRSDLDELWDRVRNVAAWNELLFLPRRDELS